MRVSQDVQSRHEALALDAGRELEDSHPEDILRWAIETFGDAFCITTSLADAVLIDLASRIRGGVRVLFADTGYHFPETLRTRAEVSQRYDVDLISPQPPRTVPEQDADLGPWLFRRDPDRCCALRKVEPLNQALAGYDAWASGIRRDETSARADVDVVQWDAARAMVKVNPLARWTESQVQDYIEQHDVVVNPLLDEGFRSIGCAPCTRPVAEGADPRSGRWTGMAKTECGLHGG